MRATNPSVNACSTPRRKNFPHPTPPPDAPIQLSCAYCGRCTVLLRESGAAFLARVRDWLASHDCPRRPAP